MPIRPRSGSRHVVRQRKSCSSSSALGCLKLQTWQPCRIDPGHDVPDGAVFPASVHPLKNQQQGIAVGRIVKLLQRVQLLNVFFQQFLILLLSTCKKGFTFVGHSLSLTFSPGPHENPWNRFSSSSLRCHELRELRLALTVQEKVVAAFTRPVGSLRISRSASSQS